MDEKDDFKDNENKNMEVVVGDTSELSFSEVGDYIGALRPKDVKGSKKNIIIPTNKKNVNPNDTNNSENTENILANKNEIADEHADEKNNEDNTKNNNNNSSTDNNTENND